MTGGPRECCRLSQRPPRLTTPVPPPATRAETAQQGLLGNTPKKSHHCFTGVCVLFLKSCSGHRVGERDFVHARTHAHTHTHTHARTVITRGLVWCMLCVSTTWASSLLKEMKGKVLVGTRRTFHGHQDMIESSETGLWSFKKRDRRRSKVWSSG